MCVGGSGSGAGVSEPCVARGAGASPEGAPALMGQPNRTNQEELLRNDMIPADAVNRLLEKYWDEEWGFEDDQWHFVHELKSLLGNDG